VNVVTRVSHRWDDDELLHDSERPTSSGTSNGIFGDTCPSLFLLQWISLFYALSTDVVILV
jgi:hypothetical protein